MKQILLFTALFTITLSSLSAKTDTLTSRSAPRSNAIRINVGDYYMPDTEHMGEPWSQIGLSVERRIFKNLFAGLAYTKWKKTKYGDVGQAIITEALIGYPIVGQQVMMEDYKMYDAWLTYKIQLASHHYLAPAIGFSQCRGVDVITEFHTILSPIETETFFGRRNVVYNGLITGITYDYYFLNSRINLGADLRFRYYPGRIKQQYDSGIHIGFCF